MRLSLTSDWFNPMLVRDLRQGLRTHRFTLTFLLLQLGLGFFVVLSLISPDQSDVVQSLNNILWTGLFLFYIFGLPGTAMSALTLEYKENRLDLLKLTQMKSRAMVWGKWYSLCAQGLLVATSLLPYLILTYFVGGVEITHEFLSLLALLGCSALLVGVGVTLSCANSSGLRLVLIIILIFIGLSYLESSLMRFGGPGMAGSDNTGMIEMLILLVAVGLPALWLVLELGAVRLAPTAENHDTPQRLVGLALVLIVGVLMAYFFHFSPAFMPRDFVSTIAVLGFIALAWIMIFAASAEPSPYPDAYRVFVRFGDRGRWVGRLLLYQGWPSAVFFVLIMTLCVFGLGAILHFESGQTTWGSEFMSFVLLLPPALLFPMVAGKVLAFPILTPAARYFVVLGGCIIVLLLCAIAYGVTDVGFFRDIPCIFPPDAWLILCTDMFNNRNGSNFDTMLPDLLAMLTSVPIMYIAIRRAIFYWPKFAELEMRAAKALPAKTLPDNQLPPSRTSPPVVDKPAAL